MLRNYLVAAWRNLKKNKLYSVISIGGLSVGIGVCMLIMIYVAHEMSYDRFHKKADQVFSIANNVRIDGQEFSMDRMSYESASMIKDAAPAVENFLRMKEGPGDIVIENTALPGKKFSEKNILFADSNFFNFFSFHLIQGDPKNVLIRPYTMVLSKRAAQKYFGNENPIGKLLKYDGKNNFEITGIAADPPSNSSIDFDFIGSIFDSVLNTEAKNDPSAGKVQGGDFKTFLRLNDKASLQVIEKIVQKLSGMPETKFRYSLNAFVKRHMNYGDSSASRYMKIFFAVAILILLLALINYMSLATARSTIRSKEIGVRKVLGANRGKIIKQFYVESALYTLLAFLFGFLLFATLEPWFYNMMQLKIDNSFLSGSFAVSIFIGLLLLTIIIAGSYPSLILSAFNPVKVLYGKFSRQRSGASVRKFFTVLQFTVSIALIISSIVINRQLYFFRHVDTGVNRENIIMIPYPEQVSNHYSAFRREVESIRGINKTAIDQNYMYGGQDITIARPSGSKASFPMTVMTVDKSFIELLGLQWKIPPADKQIIARNGNVVINEAAVEKLNLPADPVGQQVSIGDTMVVAGVLKDFNYISLHHKIEPLCLFVRNETDSLWRSDMGGCLFAKIDRGVNIPTVLESIKKVYGNFTTIPFEYNFMDEAFDAQYKAEDRLSKIFSALTVLTILIACMGLFGLAAFSAAQRTKEIGIRKVLGANVSSIVAMISGSFIKLVLVSVVIATPVAWFFMSKWLQDFAYRINIGWWVFILAGIIAVVIAFATVGFQALKAAIANPIKSLRTE